MLELCAVPPPTMVLMAGQCRRHVYQKFECVCRPFTLSPFIRRSFSEDQEWCPIPFFVSSNFHYNENEVLRPVPYNCSQLMVIYQSHFCTLV